MSAEKLIVQAIQQTEGVSAPEAGAILWGWERRLNGRHAKLLAALAERFPGVAVDAEGPVEAPYLAALDELLGKAPNA